MDKELPVSAWPEWKIIEKIGEGSFGKVYKAQRTERGKIFLFCYQDHQYTRKPERVEQRTF